MPVKSNGHQLVSHRASGGSDLWEESGSRQDQSEQWVSLMLSMEWESTPSLPPVFYIIITEEGY